MSESTALVGVDGTAGDLSTPLTTDQAQELTETIRSTSDVLYVLLARAHAGKAWVALGYNSFSDYVGEEFNMSRSRAYQIIDQARVIEAIESAVPDGTDLPTISEAAARDLKSIIGEVVPVIRDRTEGLSPQDAGYVVEEVVEQFRAEPAFRDDAYSDYNEGSDFDSRMITGSPEAGFGGGFKDVPGYGPNDGTPRAAGGVTGGGYGGAGGTQAFTSADASTDVPMDFGGADFEVDVNFDEDFDLDDDFDINEDENEPASSLAQISSQALRLMMFF